MTVLRKGDTVIAFNGTRTVEARVTLASPNGRSLVIAWDDGMLGGHVGVMPIFQDESGAYRALIDGTPITLTRKSA